MRLSDFSGDLMPSQSHSARRAKLMKNKTIKVDYLARVEGEGGLFIKIKNDKIVIVVFIVFSLCQLTCLSVNQSYTIFLPGENIV